MKWNIGWGTISKCNMNCAFCYSKTRRKEGNDLNFNDWVKFIDENAKNINSINYGTGENTLSDDWFSLAEHIRKNYPGIRQSLTTNGHLSVAVRKEENLKKFIYSIDEVDVSLDFCEAEKHNSFRGQPMAYSWAIDTLSLCKKTQKKATVVFLGSRINIYEENIDGLFAIAKQWDAILRMNIYRPVDGINEFTEKFILDRERLLNILLYINAKYNILSIGDAYLSPLLAGTSRPDPSGSISIRILADGSITPSTYLINGMYTVGNIRQKNILEVLEKEQALKKVIYAKLPCECLFCAYKEDCCGGVFDRRYLWNGSLDKKDPYCPGTYSSKIKPVIKICNSDFSSVHDGYLPTMFFKP